MSRKIYRSRKTSEAVELKAGNVFLAFDYHGWWGLSAVDKSKIKNSPAKMKHMKSVFSDDSMLKDVLSTVRKAVQFVDRMAAKYPFGGFHVISRDRIDFFQERLSEMQVRVKESASRLADAMPELIRQTERDLKAEGQRLGFDYKDFFDRNSYPSAAEIRDVFTLEWNFLTVGPDEGMRESNPDIYNDRYRRFQRQWEAFEKDAFEAGKKLLLEKLKNIFDSDNVRKRSITALENALQRYTEVYEGYIGQKNFSNVVKDIRKEMRSLLKSADRIADDENFNDQVKDSFSTMADKLSDIEYKKPKRAIRF